MSHTKLRPFIVKVSVLGYSPLCDVILCNSKGWLFMNIIRARSPL